MVLLNKTTDFFYDYRPHLIIFMLALGARLAFLFGLDDPILFFKYPYFAEKLALGEDIGSRLADLSPFYLYFLTLLKKFFNIDWMIVKFIQSFIGAVNGILIYEVGRQVFPKAVGFLAALMYAIYGNLIILESTLEPMVFVLLFNLLGIYFLLLSQNHPNKPKIQDGYVFVAGVFTGLSIITKPSFLLFPPIALAWLFFSRSGKPFVYKALKSCALFLAAILLMVMPITLRNYVKLNDVVLVTADAGKVFYRGNAMGATALEGGGLVDEGFAEEGQIEPDYAHVLFRETASRVSGKSLSPSESSKFWMRKTVKEIMLDPGIFAKRELKKIVYFFTDYEMHYIASAYKEYKMSLRFPFLRYGVIASLGILGMFLSLADAKKRFLLYGVVGIYLVSGLLFLVQSRYRTPAVPYLCLFAGHTIYSLYQGFKLRNLRSTALIVLFIAILMFLSHRSFKGEIERVDLWQKATKIHYQMGAVPFFTKGKYNEAILELNKCLSIAPEFSPAYNLRGKTYALLGRYLEAEIDFKKVVGLSPNITHGYKNLGFLYLLQGNKEMAKTYLEIARRLSPQNKKIQEALSK